MFEKSRCNTIEKCDARSVHKKQGDSGSSGWVQSPFEVPAKATWEDYLALEPKEDVVTEVPIDPYSMDSSPGKPIKQVTHLVSLPLHSCYEPSQNGRV